MLKLQLWFVKAIFKTYTPHEQIKVEPDIAIVKDLLSDNIDGHVIQFEGETARIVNLVLKINIDLW